MSSLCGDCVCLNHTVTEDTVKKALHDQGSENEEDLDSEDEFEEVDSGSEDDAGSDMGEDGSAEDEESLSDPGSIVCVLWGKQKISCQSYSSERCASRYSWQSEEG